MFTFLGLLYCKNNSTFYLILRLPKTGLITYLHLLDILMGLRNRHLCVLLFLILVRIDFWGWKVPISTAFYPFFGHFQSKGPSADFNTYPIWIFLKHLFGKKIFFFQDKKIYFIWKFFIKSLIFKIFSSTWFGQCSKPSPR